MKIQQITLNNIGPYIGENAISFSIGDVSKNIIIIGGRNGAGKTTLFDAMKICLYGYKLYGYRQNSQSYTAKVKRLMNDSTKRNQTPTAGVSLSIFIDDGYTNNVFTISRNWSLQNNQIKESCDVYKDDSLLSDEEQVDFDNYLLQTIPPALFNFHFFNGENISDFLFDKEKGQSFRKAFMQICGLDTLDLIQNQLHSNIRTKSKDNSFSIQEEYQEKKSRKLQMEAEADEIAAELKQLRSDIIRLEEQAAILEQEMSRFGGVQSKEWQKLQEKIKEEERRREDAHRFLKDSANSTLPFLILKNELEALCQQIRLESYIASNRVIEERILKKDTRETLTQRLVPYLKSSSEQLDNGFFKALFEAVKYNYPQGAKEILKLSEREQINLLAKIEQYSSFDKNTILNAESAIKKSLSRTKRLREKLDSKEVLSSADYLSQKNELLTQIDVLRQQVVAATAKKMQFDEALKLATQEFDKSVAKLKDVLKEKSISDMSARAALAFDELRESLYSKYITQVESAFIQNFNLLLTKDSLLDGIYISSDFEVIPYKHSLFDIKEIRAMLVSNGEEYVLEHLGERAFSMVKAYGSLDGQIELPLKIEQHFSAGEQQIFAMALYQALSEIRLTEIPFVIDTPLARIDSVHRKNILNNFFSKLPGQVVILSTDEEIDTTSIGMLQDQLSDLYLIENQDDGSTKVLHNQYFEGVSN